MNIDQLTTNQSDIDLSGTGFRYRTAYNPARLRVTVDFEIDSVAETENGIIKIFDGRAHLGNEIRDAYLVANMLPNGGFIIRAIRIKGDEEWELPSPAS